MYLWTTMQTVHYSVDLQSCYKISQSAQKDIIATISTDTIIVEYVLRGEEYRQLPLFSCNALTSRAIHSLQFAFQSLPPLRLRSFSWAHFSLWLKSKPTSKLWLPATTISSRALTTTHRAANYSKQQLIAVLVVAQKQINRLTTNNGISLQNNRNFQLPWISLAILLWQCTYSGPCTLVTMFYQLLTIYKSPINPQLEEN